MFPTVAPHPCAFPTLCHVPQSCPSSLCLPYTVPCPSLSPPYWHYPLGCRTSTLQMLKRKYEALIDIALTAQNIFDTLATFLERVQVRAWA